MKKSKINTRLALLGISGILSLYNCVGCVKTTDDTVDSNSITITDDDGYNIILEDGYDYSSLVSTRDSLDNLYFVAVNTFRCRTFLEKKYSSEEIEKICCDVKGFDVSEYDWDELCLMGGDFNSLSEEEQFITYKSLSNKLKKMLNSLSYSETCEIGAHFCLYGSLKGTYDGFDDPIISPPILPGLSHLVEACDNKSVAQREIRDLLSSNVKENRVNYIYFDRQLYDFVKLYDRYNYLANKAKKSYLNSDDLNKLIKLKNDIDVALNEQIDDLIDERGIYPGLDGNYKKIYLKRI